jgi:hypothetical protein
MRLLITIMLLFTCLVFAKEVDPVEDDGQGVTRGHGGDLYSAIPKVVPV